MPFFSGMRKKVNGFPHRGDKSVRTGRHSYRDGRVSAQSGLHPLWNVGTLCRIARFSRCGRRCLCGMVMREPAVQNMTIFTTPASQGYEALGDWLEAYPPLRTTTACPQTHRGGRTRSGVDRGGCYRTGLGGAASSWWSASSVRSTSFCAPSRRKMASASSVLPICSRMRASA